MPPNKPSTVCIGTRVAPETRAAIDGLRELYPGATARGTTRSDLVRAFVDAAMPVVGDIDLHRRLQRLATARASTIGEVLRAVVVRGLAALESGR